MDEFKKNKWSKKYDCCVICGSTKKKHKGRGIGLCCWEEERLKNPKRLLKRKLSRTKYWFKIKIFSRF